MKKRIIITTIIILLAAAITCTLLLTQREGSKGILYRVTGDTATAYLLGSIHIGTPEMHPFGETLQDAMASSDTFVFECDTSTDESVSRLLDRQSVPADTTLADILGDALYDDAVSAYQALHLSTASLANKQPWAVINTLAVYSSAAEMGVRNIQKAISLGVEAAVQDYAAKHNKRYAYLETVDEVADTMESFSDALTLYLLQDEIDIVLGRTAPTDLDTLSKWPSWWHTGDVNAFRDFYSLSFQSADEQLYTEYQSKLITQRNALMVDRLDTLLQQGGTYFITVGLLHLIPEDDSFVSLLRKKGYAVELVSQP